MHNWHWAEKDCLPWSKKRLAQLLENLDILKGEQQQQQQQKQGGGGGLRIATTKAEVNGEAYVNMRKGKIIPGYEISVRLSWIGEAKKIDGNNNSNHVVKVEGIVDLPYIADENATEEPEFKVSVTTAEDNAAGERLQEAFVAIGKPVLLEKIALYVKEMAAGGPAQDELEGNGGSSSHGKPEKVVDATEKKSQKNNPATAATTINPSPPNPKIRNEGFRTISLVERFHCRPGDLYLVLLDENRWRAFTQSAAKISNREGGAFSIFDGAVTGVNLQLRENQLLVQKWRFSSWVDGHYSNVCLTLEEPEIGVTVVKLTQTDVPEEDRFGNATVVENTERGWQDLVFHRIHAVFGYGL